MKVEVWDKLIAGFRSVGDAIRDFLFSPITNLNGK
jgi:hypothetical protein